MDAPILIAGLGNPGDTYQKTRHNSGFMVIDALMRDVTPSGSQWERSTRVHSMVWKGSIEERPVILALPQTHMNNSGQAVDELREFYKIPLSNLWVVHDDLDLPIGKLKIRLGGGSGGHRGIESIMENLRTDQFIRLRIGIGHPRILTGGHENPAISVDNYVLSAFTPSERHIVRQEIKRAVRALREALANGLDAAMNRYNQ